MPLPSPRRAPTGRPFHVETTSIAGRHGLRRLGAFTAPAVLSLLATGLLLGSPEPPAPRPVGQLSAPAHVAGDPLATPPPAGEPVIDSPALVAVELPAPDPVPEPEPEPAPAPAPVPCADALARVAAAGLPLPAGVAYRCPSTQFAHQGAACWDDWPCPGRAFVAINLDLGAGATPARMDHVVAHEICHIIDFRDRGWSTEPRADACAASYGF
jgi:hypothetical protein